MSLFSYLYRAFLSEEFGTLAVRYLWYFLLIGLGIFFLALVRRKTSRGLTKGRVKEKCLLLRKLLEETLEAEGRKIGKSAGHKASVNPARMAKLRGAAEEAMWTASRLVDERRDLVFDGIAGSLNEIADLLAEAESAFADGSETEKSLREALRATDSVVEKIDAAMAAAKDTDE